MTAGLSRAQKRYRSQLNADITKMLAHPASLRVMAHVLDMCGMRGSSFTGNSETFYREGRRSIGLEITGMLNEVDPFAEVNLLQHAVRQRVKETENANNGDGDEV